MTLPAYAAKMEVFFADAFQQSGAQAIGFVTQLDDGSVSPFDELLQNFRVGFAKAVTELIAEGKLVHRDGHDDAQLHDEQGRQMMQYYAFADSEAWRPTNDGGRLRRESAAATTTTTPAGAGSSSRRRCPWPTAGTRRVRTTSKFSLSRT